MSSEGLIAWLLQAKTPSIRYMTLLRLCARDPDDPEVQESFTAMGETGPIPTILAQQSETGAWLGERSYYTPKYTSTHWSMLLLSELAADPGDPKLVKGATYMLEAALSQASPWMREAPGEIACFWSNLLRYGVHAGLSADPRLQAVVGILVDSALRMNWRCRHNHDRPCAWGAGRALWALSALPDDMGSAEINAAIQSGLAFLLDEYRLVDGNYPTPREGKVSSLWERLNFPLFYQVDILLVLRALAALGELGRSGAESALDWLRARQTSDGRWHGASPFRQRTWPLGDREETDRWVSLQAALILAQI